MASKAKDDPKELNAYIHENAKWAKVAETNTVATRIVHYVNGIEIVSADDLMKLWNISDKTIKRYIAQGIPIAKESMRGFRLFPLEKALEWREIHINKDQSIKTVGRKIETADDAEYIKSLIEKNNYLRKSQADADKSEEDAIIARLKRQKEEGSLISSEDLDIAQAEQAIMYQSNYMQDKKSLPQELKDKSSGEIKRLLDKFYAKRMDDLNTLINKEFPDCEKSLYDVINECLEQMKLGTSSTELMKRLKK